MQIANRSLEQFDLRVLGQFNNRPLEVTRLRDLEPVPARLAFADRSFDVVIGQYLITAVPDPEATLDEFVRVLKPGGEIILVNHLAAETGPRRLFEQAFAPIARRLGWQPDFGWDRLARWLARRSEMRLIERRPLTAMGHFMLMRFGKTG